MKGPGDLRQRSPLLLVFAVLSLLMLGVVMLLSTGIYHADAKQEDLYFDVKRQAGWIGIGVGLAGAVSLVHYRVWLRWRWVAYGGCVVLLGLCFVPGVGLEINGERRWVDLGVRFQPSEFAKLVLVGALAAWYSWRRRSAEAVWEGFLLPGLMAGLLIGLVALEVDVGSSAVMALAALAVMWLAGVHRACLRGALLSGCVVLAGLVMLVPGRMERVLAVVRPELHEQGVGLQQKVAKMAFGSGGVEGVGLGAGRMKMLYMPYAHTDFIFPMVGEELGLLASLGVVLCYVTIAMSGLTIALHAPDRFGFLLAAGMTAIVSIQAALNMAVTTGAFPNTGLPLPFVSYGGSNLVASLIAIGVLLNIASRGFRGRESLLQP